jgi:cytochrome c biogenesis protein CcmG, thiol:disulfide interchange protein DsbE
MRRQWIVVLVVLAALGIGAVALIRTAPARVEVGSVAPDFTANDIHTGKEVSLRRDFAGKVTLVNIWATYCVPCQKEIPAMDSLYQAYASRGLRIAAVSVDIAPVSVVQKFASDYKMTFDVLHDPSLRIQDTYQTTGVPESFLLDRHGRIMRIAQLAAPWNSAENRRIVEELLNDSGA